MCVCVVSPQWIIRGANWQARQRFCQDYGDIQHHCIAVCTSGPLKSVHSLIKAICHPEMDNRFMKVHGERLGTSKNMTRWRRNLISSCHYNSSQHQASVFIFLSLSFLFLLHLCSVYLSSVSLTEFHVKPCSQACSQQVIGCHYLAVWTSLHAAFSMTGFTTSQSRSHLQSPSSNWKFISSGNMFHYHPFHLN